MGERGQKIQTSSYKTNKCWGCTVQHGDYNFKYCIAYLKVAKRVDLKSYHKKKNVCCTPDMHIMLRVNCISIKKKEGAVRSGS